MALPPHRHWLAKANVDMVVHRVAVFDFVTDCDDIPVGDCGFGSKVVDYGEVTAFEKNVARHMVVENDMAFAEAPWPTQPK